MPKAESVHSTPRRTASKIVLIPVATDPIFDLIDAHRQAEAAHIAALELQNRLEKIHGVGRSSWVSTKPCHDENDAFEALVGAPASTLPGLIAKLAYLQDLGTQDETGEMLDEREGTALRLIESFAASIRNIGLVQP